MCGIFGIFNNLNREFTKDILTKSLSTIRHRGPDNSGFFMNKNIFMGMTRLAIIDLNTGNQPIFDSKKEYALVYNGEIYNFKDLKKRFNKKFIFQTQTDTEVLLAGLIHFGADFLKDCNGIYSFAFYDIKKNKLILGRDPLGVKPLYYTIKNRSLIFCSELTTFRNSNDFFTTRPSVEGAINYFSSFYTFSPTCSYKDFKMLPPGSVAEYSTNKMSPNIIFYYPKDFKLNQPTKEFNLKNEIVSAVDRQLVSDVPVGLLLSSGMDSMSILASLKILNKVDQLKTYTSYYENKNFSEDFYVKQISKDWKINSEFIPITSSDVFNNLDDYFNCFDDLEFMPNSFAMYYLCKQIKGKNKVLLSGIGGDEIFLSYKTHIANNLKKFFPRSSKLINIINIFAEYLPNSNKYLGFKEKLIRFSQGGMHDIKYSYFIWRNIFSPKEIKEHFKDPYSKFNIDQIFYNQIKLYDDLRLQNYSEKSFMSYIDIYTWLIDHGLKLWDKAGMYNSIEIRVPFLDLELLNNLFYQNDKVRNTRLGKKTALIKAFEDILPSYITKFPKRGFAIPVFDWLSNKKINHKFKDLTYSLKDNFINEKFLNSLWRELDYGNNNVAFKLWNLGCYEGWRRASRLN